jgi:hypothetical protein
MPVKYKLLLMEIMALPIPTVIDLKVAHRGYTELSYKNFDQNRSGSMKITDKNSFSFSGKVSADFHEICM